MASPRCGAPAAGASWPTRSVPRTKDEPSAGARRSGLRDRRLVLRRQHGRHSPGDQRISGDWDRDSLSADDLLVVGVVGFDGRYRLCFSSNDGVGDSTQEVYVKYLTQNTVAGCGTRPPTTDVRVHDETVDVCDTCDHEYGNRQPADTALMPGLRAFDEIGDLWQFVAGGSQNLLRPQRHDVSRDARQLDERVDRRDGLPERQQPDPSPRQRRPRSTVVHEEAALMDDVYEDDAATQQLPGPRHPGRRQRDLRMGGGLRRVAPGPGLQQPDLPVSERQDREPGDTVLDHWVI